jgi:hypothetical protein
VHVALFKQRAAVVNHLRITAYHHPGALRLEGKTGCLLQLAIVQQRGNTPVQTAGLLVTGQQR